jgi:methyl-accepting chemotaxis protein
MSRFKNWNIGTKLLALVLVVGVGFVIFGWVSYSAIAAAKVGGPMYDRIALSKDLYADASPATLYLSEARMNVLSYVVLEDPVSVQKSLESYQEAKKAFEDSFAQFNRQLPDGPIKELMNGKAHQEGLEWLKIVDTLVIPARTRGDVKGALAALQSSTSRFVAHREASLALADEIAKEDKQLVSDTGSSIQSRTEILVALGGGILLFVVIIGWFTSRGITVPLSKTVAILNRVAEGDLRERVDIDSEDEAGVMGKALNLSLDKIEEVIRSVAENAQQVASASEEFSAVSQQITSNSEETTAQANVVSTATDQVNRNLQTVATGAEEMSSTIQDIAKNATESARVAGEAVRTAETTNTTISKLGVSSAEIGQVIKVITSIAQQTNLLALNATIEAARAGEAGKGFAVVANEVKELAKQTAKATEDISQKIAAIQSDTKGAVDAIATIGAVINQISDISSTIASAVEEQSATTNEMARNVTEAAKGSTEITQNIAGVSEAAQGTSSSAHESMKAAQQLALMSTQLRGLIDQFKVGDIGHGNGRSQRHAA